MADNKSSRPDRVGKHGSGFYGLTIPRPESKVQRTTRDTSGGSETERASNADSIREGRAVSGQDSGDAEVNPVEEWEDEPNTDIIKALLQSDEPGSNEQAEKLARQKLQAQAKRLTPPSFGAVRAMNTNHYALITEKDESGWTAELRDLDGKDRVWLGAGPSELDAISNALMKFFESVPVT